MCKVFPGRASDPKILFQSESTRHEWRPSSILEFWKSRRWRIPISQDSELDAPLTPASDTERESISDGEYIEMAVKD